MIPDPTVKLLGWVATRAGEMIVERIAVRVATAARVRVVSSAKQRTIQAAVACRARLK